MEIRNKQTSEIFGIVQQNIRHYLVCRRQEENFSLRQLSDKSGIALEVLADVESGRREISIDCLLKLLDFYRQN